MKKDLAHCMALSKGSIRISNCTSQEPFGSNKPKNSSKQLKYRKTIIDSYKAQMFQGLKQYQ